MIWNEPNNKSHWDPETRPRLDAVRRDGETRRPRHPAEHPTSPRVLGGISPIDPSFIAQPGRQGRARACGRGRGARLPARLEPLADRRMAGEARGDPRRHRPAGLGIRGRRLVLRRRGGAGLGPAGAPPSCCSAAPPASTGTACTTCRAPGPRRPGTARRRAPPTTGISTWACCARTARRSPRCAAFSPPTRRSSGSASGSTSRIPGWTTRCAWLQRLGVKSSAHRAVLGRQLPAQCAGLVRPPDGGAGGVRRDRHLLLHPGAPGIAPHHTSPPRRSEEFAEFCASMVRRYAR